MKKPVSPAMHSAIDYALGGALMTIPAAIGMNDKTAANYRKLAVGVSSLTAMTDTPAGIKKMVPLKVHQMMDAGLLAGLALATAAKGLRRDKKAMIFHLSVIGMLAMNYMLTDYNA